MMTFFTEISKVFMDQFIHIGGDEVSFTCWASNPQIQEWMNEHGYTDYSMVEQYYETNLLDIMNEIGKDYIVWQEIFDNGLKVKNNTVVDVWKGGWQEELAAVTSAGLKAILSAPWYLNYISYGQDWPTYYDVEPWNFTGTQQQKELVFGGEACMWGEYVDSTNEISRMWPRASSVAERLWSPMDVTDLNSATIRIQTQQCRLIQRGINAEPPNGPSYCTNEWMATYFPPWMGLARAGRNKANNISKK
jgi:hexosaminidase